MLAASAKSEDCRGPTPDDIDQGANHRRWRAESKPTKPAKASLIRSAPRRPLAAVGTTSNNCWRSAVGMARASPVVPQVVADFMQNRAERPWIDQSVEGVESAGKVIEPNLPIDVQRDAAPERRGEIRPHIGRTGAAQEGI